MIKWWKREEEPNEESRSSHFQHSARVWDDLNYYYSENCTQNIISHTHAQTHSQYSKICVGGKAKAMNCATGFCCYCRCRWKYTIAFGGFLRKKASFELSFIFLSFFLSLSFFIEFLGLFGCQRMPLRRVHNPHNIRITKVNNDNDDGGSSSGSDDEKWNDWM